MSKDSKRPKRSLLCLTQLVTEYFAKRPDHELLQQHLDTQMAAFEAAEARDLEDSQTPDNEGFITVKSSSKSSKAPSIPAKKSHRVDDFYRFQVKRQKLGTDVEDIREKFNRDVQLLAALKSNKII